MSASVSRSCIWIFGLHLTEKSRKSSPGLKPPWRDRSSEGGAGTPQTAPSHPSYHRWPRTPLCNRQERSLEWKHNTYIKTAPAGVRQQHEPASVWILLKEGEKCQTGVTFAAVGTFIITHKSHFPSYDQLNDNNFFMLRLFSPLQLDKKTVFLHGMERGRSCLLSAPAAVKLDRGPRKV